ncbi:aminomethyltransferase folate-binding domain-containing protein [Phthorimaea operculella]|nr:aminomethyltransferase folate-binding domain-containing protein [Phthorimaea operculella]
MWMTSIIHTGMQNHCSQDHQEPVSTPGNQDTWSPTMWMTSIIHTGMQNERGGYENDCSLARITENQTSEEGTRTTAASPGSPRTSEYTREPGYLVSNHVDDQHHPHWHAERARRVRERLQPRQDHREPVSTPGNQDTWSPAMWMTSIIHTGMQNHCSQDHREPVSTPGNQDTWSPAMWMTSIIHTGMQNHCSQDHREPVSTPGNQDTWSPAMWMTSIIHTGMQNERGGYENDCSLGSRRTSEYTREPGYLVSSDVDDQHHPHRHAEPLQPGSPRTSMQNEREGYENDCSLARITENHYMMIAPTIQQTRCKVWLQRHLPPTVSMSDVTSMYTALCIMGPFTRNVLSELTDTDLAPSNFPFFTFKELDVGLANGIRAMNLTHTGELGYVLYIPNEFALHVYNRLMAAGERYGIRHVGYYAARALRVEKFFAFWGQDLDTMTTPLECGRTWRVKFAKDIPFIGRAALEKQRDEGIRRQYVQLLLTDHDHELDQWSWGGEPIYRDGNYCGQTTTTSYGYTFKKQVCLGFVQNLDENGVPHRVTNDYILQGHYEIDIAGIRYAAKVNLHSPNLPTKYPDKERDVYQATRKHLEPSQYLGRHFQP